MSNIDSKKEKIPSNLVSQPIEISFSKEYQKQYDELIVLIKENLKTVYKNIKDPQILIPPPFLVFMYYLSSVVFFSFIVLSLCFVPGLPGPLDSYLSDITKENIYKYKYIVILTLYFVRNQMMNLCQFNVFDIRINGKKIFYVLPSQPIPTVSEIYDTVHKYYYQEAQNDKNSNDSKKKQ
ncbi:hypothetical protein WA158_000211 [Blastocystis sp. Blastoise]